MTIPVNFRATSVPLQNAPTETQIYNLFDRIYTQPSEQDKTAFNSYIWKTELSRLTIMLANYITGKRQWKIGAFDRLDHVRDFMSQHVFSQNAPKLQTAFRQLETTFVAHRTMNAKMENIEEQLRAKLKKVNKLNTEAHAKINRFNNLFKEANQRLDTQIADLHKSAGNLQDEVHVLTDRLQKIQENEEIQKAQKVERTRLKAQQKVQDAKLWRKRLLIAAMMITLCVIGLGAAIGLPFLFLFAL